MTTPRIEEINERIKKTHLDCECCRNWTRITELKEAEAHQAGIDEAVERVKALKRPRFIKMNGGREMYDKFSFFYNQALDDFIKALQDNK